MGESKAFSEFLQDKDNMDNTINLETTLHCGCIYVYMYMLNRTSRCAETVLDSAELDDVNVINNGIQRVRHKFLLLHALLPPNFHYLPTSTL